MDSLSEKRDFGFQIMIKSNLFKLFYILIQNMKAAESKDNKKSEEKVKEIILIFMNIIMKILNLKKLLIFVITAHLTLCAFLRNICTQASLNT